MIREGRSSPSLSLIATRSRLFLSTIRLRSKEEGIRFTRRGFFRNAESEATVSPSPIIDNWKTVNARSNCIRGFPKRSRLDNKQNLSHGKKWKRRITSRRSIIPSLLVYKSSEFHPSIHPSLPLPIHRLEQSYYRGRVCLSPANTHSFPLLRDINGHIDQMEGTNDRKWEKI